MLTTPRVFPVLLLSAAACSPQPPAQAPIPTPVAPVAAAVHRTEPAITARDLRARLFAYADDSMMGREAGTLGNVRATDYLAAELRRLGVEPAGENGTYFQTVPMIQSAVDTTVTVAVGDSILTRWKDYAPIPNLGGFLPYGMRRSLDGVQVVFGGRLGDTTQVLTPEQARGRLVVIAPPAAPINAMAALGALPGRYPDAAGVAIGILDFIPPADQGFLREPREGLGGDLPDGPLGMFVTLRTLGLLLGAPLESATLGAAGRTLRGSPRFAAQPLAYPARNVVGVVPGRDSLLRLQYVALGAHNDHVGPSGRPVDHDSVWAFNHVVRPLGAESPSRTPTADEAARIRTILDSLRALRPARPDSIYNGADDDGSGSVTLLELAEAFARAPEKPRRSILFVWHTAEEKGLDGAQHFTDNPTVPREAIVAALNMDMVGRGDTGDLPDGGPGYLQLIGSRRLSTELGDLVERVNQRANYGFTFDYTFDADGHPQNYYCRSDHYMYARYGIPIVFFTTGSHQDYHQLTDEPQYIAYDKMARVGRFVMDLARTVADLDHRVVVDKPKPDPTAPCRQ
ncbi:MAG: M28 family peptidase [Gemmatimonadota bacterium]|nr:M28 family peptidase [Gemmatimonadota bacterium]